MANQPIHSENAPKAVGPYSQAVLAGNILFCSGQLGIDPVSNELAQGFEAQASQALKNLQAVVEQAGFSLDQVVRCDIFLTDIGQFPALNEIYGKFFPFEPKPARQTAEVNKLPKNALVEISCLAVKS